MSIKFAHTLTTHYYLQLYLEIWIRYFSLLFHSVSQFYNLISRSYFMKSIINYYIQKIYVHINVQFLVSYIKITVCQRKQIDIFLYICKSINYKSSEIKKNNKRRKIIITYPPDAYDAFHLVIIVIESPCDFKLRSINFPKDSEMILWLY